MAININALAELAERMIAENGRAITLLKSNATPIDSAKPWRGQTGIATDTTDAQVTAVAAIGVFLNQADQDNFGLIERDVFGQLNKIGTQRVLVAELELSPGTDVSDFDILKDGTRAWRITDANVLQPGGTRVLYDFEVRQ